jgi:hypothetical protein
MELDKTLVSHVMDEMDPRVLPFIQDHVTTFTRWEAIRFLYENPHVLDTAENLAQHVGRATDVICREAKELAQEGIFRSETRGGRLVYQLTDDVAVRELIALLVAAAQDRAFRMRLVYHILRAGGLS